MRVGTVLHYNLPEGKSFGVVNHLISPNSVRVQDKGGNQYVVFRGQGHKHEDQGDQFCNGLRSKFGITVGDCQKTEYGADAVHDAENAQTLRGSTFDAGYPLPVPTTFNVEILAKAQTRAEALELINA